LTLNLGTSAQNMVFLGLGGNAQGDGQVKVTLGACAYDGTSTNCTLSGSYSMAGTSGSYLLVTTYPGNGESPIVGVSTVPGGGNYTFYTQGAAWSLTFTQPGGGNLFISNPSFSLFFGPTICTGVPTCSSGLVGLTPGATIRGPISGNATGSVGLTFPIHGISPGEDQNLTPSTAQINTVFDHEMVDSDGQFSVYGCDKQVEDFAGELGDGNPDTSFHIACRTGYASTVSGFEFLQNIATYSGNPYLYYDGHPGYDFQSTFGNQVYAAMSGTITYPTQSDLTAQGVYIGGNPDVFNVMELDPGNGYKIFHLHLSTSPRNIATQQKLTTDLVNQNFVATQTGTAGKMVPGVLPVYQPIAISGQVSLNGQPLAGVTVNLNSSIALGENGSCTASTTTDRDGNYMFVGLQSGYYYNLYVSATMGYTFAAQNPVVEVSDGAAVFAGDLIALSGNAGPCTPGHLHFEVQQKTNTPVTVYLSPTSTLQLDYVPVDPYGWSPTSQGLGDPYLLIPQLQGSGVINSYLWSEPLK